jgi:hypothetical protein
MVAARRGQIRPDDRRSGTGRPGRRRQRGIGGLRTVIVEAVAPGGGLVPSMIENYLGFP